MKRKASEAMEYFAAAATTQQQSNLYRPLPPALLAVAASSSSSSASPSPASSVPPTSSIPSFLTSLLPSSALSAYQSKLHGKFVQLAAAQPRTAAPATHAQPATRRQQHRQQRSATRAARPLTVRQRRRLRLLSLPAASPSAALRYSAFEPLHELWLSYIRDLLSQPTSSLPLSLGERLLKADYHGARVTVARSTAASYVHASGIVIQESENGWRIIGEDDVVRLVRKEGSVLSLDISAADDGQQQQQEGGWQVELYGDQLAVRSAERAAKKWKGKSSIQMNG